MPGQPKAPFFVVLILVVLGLIGFSAYRWGNIIAPTAGKGHVQLGGPIDPKELGHSAETGEATSTTTVTEYRFKPSERLPEVKGTSAYSLKDNTVRFALNVWAGWGPIILANEGFKPGKVWKTPDGQDFKVELVLIDDPVKMRDAYAAGEVQIGWATLDMVPLFVDGLVKTGDSRIMPRIYQQIDWSNGGDGIVVREDIKTVADLRGKKMVMAQNSPSQYFALNMLVAGGVQPAEVNLQYTEDAFQAAAAFNADKTISGAVSWAPDIYTLADVKGNRMLVTTQTASRLIADVWFARADFAKDHPGKIEALVRGIFDAMEELKDPEKKQKCADFMGKGYNIPPTDAIKMFGDAHNTNWAENYQFFMNQNNPTNFERIWRQAYYLYRRMGAISSQNVPFDAVMDFSVIEKLRGEEKYSTQKNEYKPTYAPMAASDVKAESEEIVSKPITINFDLNSFDLRRTITREVDGRMVQDLYDPSVDAKLEEIAKLTEQFGNARVVIEGHTDSSMMGKAVESLVKKLSDDRAKAVKNAVVEKFKLDPNKFSAVGMGWDVPADPNEPLNQFKNRRVEIKIYRAEK
jgi:NitT/TauT family transport system substrate-binding protein